MSTASDAARMALVDRIVGFTISRAVHVAVQLGLADLIGDGTLTAEELAEEVDADPDQLHRLLRALSGHGIFFDHGDGRFSNSEQSALLHDQRMRDLATVVGQHFYPAFGELEHSVRTGEPSFDRVFGATFDEHLAGEVAASRTFNRFMSHGKSEVAVAVFAELSGDGTVIDVGGGNGALVHELLRLGQELRGVVFDLPHVASEASQRSEDEGLSDRCEVVPGSFFDRVPEGGDVYILSHILHDWGDDEARAILRNVRLAMGGEGRLLVMDGLVAGPNEPGQKVMDLMMSCIGGRERTVDEWRALLRAAGFVLDGARAAGSSHLLACRPVGEA